MSKRSRSIFSHQPGFTLFRNITPVLTLFRIWLRTKGLPANRLITRKTCFNSLLHRGRCYIRHLVTLRRHFSVEPRLDQPWLSLIECLTLLLCPPPLCPACFLSCCNPSPGGWGHRASGSDGNNLPFNLCPASGGNPSPT